MKKSGAVIATLGAVLISLSAGCSSSSLVDKWHDPAFLAPPLQKMLVIAVRKDATKRRIWEDAFTTELGRHGMLVTPSYRLFEEMPPDTDQVIAAIKAHAFDGVLAIIMLPAETIKQFFPGYTTYEKDSHYQPYFGTYWQRYRSYYREIEHPGYTDSQTIDLRAIDVSTTGSDSRLIWSATSRTPDPASVTDVQRNIVQLVIKELVRKRIISTRIE